MTTVAHIEEDAELLTGEEAYALGDIGPYELVEGRIVRMAPTKPKHGDYEYRLASLLGSFVEANQLGKIMVGEVGIYVRRDPDTVRAPDVLFISYERLAQATPESFFDVAPELVVEIMSPSDRWVEVRRKLREYFDAGVIAVLVVELDTRTILLYRSPTDVQEFSEQDILKIEEVLSGFQLPLTDLFGTSEDKQ